MGRAGLTLGVGPSHQPVIEGIYGMSYDTPGRHTEEYVGGADADPARPARHPRAGRRPRSAPAPGRRRRRRRHDPVDGERRGRSSRTSRRASTPPPRPRAGRRRASSPGCPSPCTTTSTRRGRPPPQQFATYGTLPNYQRILAHGGVDGPADAAIVGDEASVAAQLQGLLDAGATDIWAAPFPVGDDRAGSRRRTRDLLKELIAR